MCGKRWGNPWGINGKSMGNHRFGISTAKSIVSRLKWWTPMSWMYPVFFQTKGNKMIGKGKHTTTMF